MKKFATPEVEVETFYLEDILTESTNDPTKPTIFPPAPTDPWDAGKEGVD